MNTTSAPTNERRVGVERRRNTAAAVNSGIDHVLETRTVVDGPRRISWGAVLAGVVLALVTQLTLSLLGLAIGFSASDGRLGVATAIWMVLTTVIALFIGGATASRLSGVERRDGAVHGLITWGIMALVAFYLMSTAVGRVVSFSTGDLTSGLSRIGGGVGATVPPVTERMKDVTELGDDAVGARDPTTRPESVNRDAPTTSVYAGTAAFWGFIGLCVGALSAALGGYVGAAKSRTRRRAAVIA